jgi:hypothetical protein
MPSEELEAVLYVGWARPPIWVSRRCEACLSSPRRRRVAEFAPTTAGCKVTGYELRSTLVVGGSCLTGRPSMARLVNG